MLSLQVDYRGLTVDDYLGKILSYGDCLDYVLIDPSIGRGKDFDIEYSSTLYMKIKDKRSCSGIVFAGGLSGDNIEEVLEKVIDRIGTKDFSICAEAGFRDKISDVHWSMDVLNKEKMESIFLEQENSSIKEFLSNW